MYLNTRGWTIHNRVVVALQTSTRIEEIAAKLRDIDGAEGSGKPKVPAHQAAFALKTSRETIVQARQLNIGVQSNKRQRKPPACKRVVNRCQPTPQLIAEVLQKKDVLKWSFPRIGKAMGFSEDKARALYDLGHPEKVMAAMESGTFVDRGSYSHLGPEKYQKIRELLKAQISVPEVAKRIGVGKSTVWREKERMKAG